jgi:hypothetical protein
MGVPKKKCGDRDAKILAVHEYCPLCRDTGVLRSGRERGMPCYDCGSEPALDLYSLVDFDDSGRNLW